MNKNIIDTVRKNINGSELTIVSKTESLQELWKEKQELIVQMNAAKKAAAELAAKPYMDAIAEIDEMYATILALSS